ncbi:hypothetical protein DESC_760045 [Desulfosarcina cetonica]|nr:hypothetical protein DESC_760045 [Desulfosarcina cetonica]
MFDGLDQGHTGGNGRGRFGRGRHATSHLAGLAPHGIIHRLPGQGAGLADLHAGGNLSLGHPGTAVVALHGNGMIGRAEGIRVEADHAVGTGHGAGGAIDAAVRVDHHRAGVAHAVDGACQAGRLAGRRIAVAATVGKAFVEAAGTHVNARLGLRALQGGGEERPAARVGRGAGQHALHAADAAVGVDDDLVHKPSFGLLQ